MGRYYIKVDSYTRSVPHPRIEEEVEDDKVDCFDVDEVTMFDDIWS